MNTKAIFSIFAIALLVPPAAAVGDLVVPDVEALLEGAPRTTGVVVGFHVFPEEARTGTYAGYRVVEYDDVLNWAALDATSVEVARATLVGDENVRYVEDNAATHKAFYTPNDPFWGTSDYQWGAKQIYAHIAWDKTRGSTGVKLCVTDTGIHASHEEFYGYTRILRGYDFVYEDTTPNDPNGHGTHVIGIASAQMNNAKGMAGTSQTTLLPVRVLDGAGSGTPTDIAQGVRYCADQGSHIISMSLGGGASTTIQDAIVYAQNKGLLVIAATGNDGCYCTSYPAGYSGVLGVGATDKSNARASFSNYGPAVDIVAPGVSIVSAYKPLSNCTNNCYVYLDGTSMATPFVSGVAALVKSYNSGLTASQLSGRLTSTAQDLGSSGRDDYYGYGLVRADRAVY
ncbi:MAG TPA: S8 family serine peptidase [Candidatus Thermoplasmatota archaeon]|nr:S8 family serine peptidase [Candidatus Thermoplasmatota archaeon]